jgi:uncharacterized membrane protein
MIIKKNWKTLLITSIIILLPIAAGLILWDRLPEQVPMHWGPSGEVDGYGSRGMFVFILPVVMLAFHWLCMIVTSADPKKKNHTDKTMTLVLWIIPVIEIMLSIITYMTVLGYGVRVEIIVPAFMGLLLVVIGNYLPKCKQTYSVGIKIPWTLNSEENWNKTHRFAGWLWTICGLVVMLTGFFGGFWIFFGVVLLMVLAPCIYSYILHRKGI